MSNGPNGRDLAPTHISTEAVQDKPQSGEGMVIEEVAPIFEVIIPSAILGSEKPLHHFKFWSDGRVEGFSDLASATRSVQVVNRIPMLIEMNVVAPLHGFLRDLAGYVDSVQQANEALRAGPPPPKGEQQ